jgi:hypothetical protein
VSSELDLRGLDRAHDPDPAFVARLRLQLIAASSNAVDAATRGDDHLENVEPAVSPASLVDLDDRRPRRPRRRTIVGLAAAVALVVALAGVAITTDHHDSSLVTQADGRWPQPVHTKLFDLEFGDHVALPPAPIHDWRSPSAGWTGTELLLWSAGKGVAFDPANGTWRAIAGAPDAKGGSPIWTGTEMILGNADGPRYQGAAYNPTSDTWRHLPDAPIGGNQTGDAPAVWTGNELVVFGSRDQRPAAAAYDPTRDQWRRLADPPFAVGAPIWTGRSILARSRSGGIARYDIAADTWTTIAGVYAALLGATDADGSARTVLGVPVPNGNGAPIDVLDRDGRIVGSLPAPPLDPKHFGSASFVRSAMWVGGEAVLVVHGINDGGPCCYPEVWALDPVAEQWHQLPEYEQVTALAAGDVLFTWPRDMVDPYGFVAYRIHR